MGLCNSAILQSCKFAKEISSIKLNEQAESIYGGIIAAKL